MEGGSWHIRMDSVLAGAILEQPREIRLAYETGLDSLFTSATFLDRWAVVPVFSVEQCFCLFFWIFWGNLLSRLVFQVAGEYFKTWRRRWFVLKQGRIFWFKENYLSPVNNLSLPIQWHLQLLTAFSHCPPIIFEQNCFRRSCSHCSNGCSHINGACKGFVRDMRLFVLSSA